MYTEIEIADVGLRVLFVEHMDALDVVVLCHRARDADRHRHGIAVFHQRGDLEFDLAGPHHGSADGVPDSGGQRRGCGFDGSQCYKRDCAKRRRATGELIPRDIITSFACRYNGIEIFRADLFPAIAANPFITFFAVATESGKFDFEWIGDKGFSETASAAIVVE